MLSQRRLRPTRVRREGFTLIELVVAMAIMVVVIYVAFTTLGYAMGMARRAQNRSEVQADLSAVIDQATKELRETTTQDDGVGGATCYGVTVPAPAVAFPATPTVAVIWHLNNILKGTSPPVPLSEGQNYLFVGSTDIPDKPVLLEFYVYDVDPLDPTPATPSLPLVKHRIRYGLSIPASGALAWRYWPWKGHQPLQVTYANDYYSGTSWSSVTPQPVTGQVVTDFTVIRPAGSRGAIQLLIEASVPSASGGGVSPIRMVAQVTVRQ